MEDDSRHICISASVLSARRFIGTALSIQTLTDPGASVGVHLAYIAQFFAYAISTPIGYRSLAVFASIFEIVGNLFEQKSFGLFRSGFDIPSMEQALATLNDEDLFPIFYDQLFIIINGSPEGEIIAREIARKHAPQYS